jgi:hypothetical protein
VCGVFAPLINLAWKKFLTCGILAVHIFYLGGLMKRLLVLAAAVACSVPAFAFTKGESQADINKEVAARVQKAETLATIADAAQKAGVEVNPISLALSFYGSFEAVLGAMQTAGFDAGAAVNALVAAGGNKDALVKAAISNGANPATVTAATAAGNANTNANANTGTQAAAPAGFTGFTGNTFSRASTVGSGSGSVSKS